MMLTNLLQTIVGPSRRTELSNAGSMTQVEALELEKRSLAQLDLVSIFPDVDKPARDLSSNRKHDLKTEYIRFIVLKIYLQDFDATLLSPPSLIDQLWHAHIIDTNNYLYMCARICKTEFIHHRPAGGRDGGRVERLAFTRGAYAVMWPGQGRGSWIWKLDGDFNDEINTQAPPPAFTAHPAPPAFTEPASSGSTIQLSGKEKPSTMKVYIKDLNGKEFPIPIESHHTILELKSRIAEHEGIPTCVQKLIFAGKLLQDDLTLSDYNVQRESHLHLVVSLRG